MIQRMVTSALFAGFAAALLAGLLHFAFVQKLILLGEEYESGALVHYKGVGGSADAAAAGAMAGHDMSTMTPADAPAAADTGATATAAADNGAAAPAEETGNFSRNAWTVLFYSLGYVGYALMMLAGFALAETFGKRITVREGVLWGVAGFAAFQLAPALGLEPGLPGTVSADVGQRQMWWLATALCTGLALALLAYGRGLAAIAVAVLLLAVMHVIGPPKLDGYFGTVPPEVASSFTARVLGVGLMVWATMGAIAGWLWSRPQ